MQHQPLQLLHSPNKCSSCNYTIYCLPAYLPVIGLSLYLHFSDPRDRYVILNSCQLFLPFPQCCLQGMNFDSESSTG